MSDAIDDRWVKSYYGTGWIYRHPVLPPITHHSGYGEEIIKFGGLYFDTVDAAKRAGAVALRHTARTRK
jgi:hypothetical protein